VAQQSKLEFMIASHVEGMERVAQLVKQVDTLSAEIKLFKAATASAREAGDKLNKTLGSTAAAIRQQGAAADSLRARLDPMFVAQKRFNDEMDEADRLLDAGVISLREYTAAQNAARQSLKSAADAIHSNNKATQNGTNILDPASKALRRQRQGLQQVGMQINDFATSVSTGASLTTAFNQQIGQLGYALSIMGDAQGEATTKFQKFGQFLAGPWGAAVTVAIMLVGQMISSTQKQEEKITSLDQTFNFHKMSVKGLTEVNNLLAESQRDVERTAIGSKNAMLAAAQANLTNAKAALAAAEAESAKQFEMQRNLTAAVSKSIGREIAAPVDPFRASRFKELRQIIEGYAGEVEGAKASLFAMTVGMSAAERRVEHFQTRLGQLTETARKLGFAAVKDEIELTVAALAKAEESTKKSGGGAKETDRLKESLALVGNAAERLFNLFEAGLITSEDFKTQMLDLKNETRALNREFMSGEDILSAYSKHFEESADAARKAKESLDQTFGKTKPLEITKLDTKELIDTPKNLQKIIDKNKEIETSFESIGYAVSDAFKGMITGAQGWKSAMSGIIQAVIDELWRLFVVQQIVGFIKGALMGAFGGGGGGPTNLLEGTPYDGMATGGYPQMNKPVLVGERGPELFVPTSSGKIIPNHQLSGGGGGMIINVDARGSADPEAVRQQVQQGILEAAPSIVAAAQNRTIEAIRRPRLAGTL